MNDVTLRLGYLVRHPEGGDPTIGPDRVTAEIEALRARGFEIHAAALGSAPDGQYEKLQGALAAHVSALFGRPAKYFAGLRLALKLGGLAQFTEALLVGRWLLRQRLSHVHVHHASGVGLLAKRVFPFEMSLSIHGPEEFINPAGFHMRDKAAEAGFVRAISYFASSQIMNQCAPRDWSKIEVCYPGIDAASLPRAQFREKPEPFQLLAAGALTSAKGHLTLIGAVEQLIREGRSVNARIVGAGPFRAVLEGAIRQAGLESLVVCTGPLNREELSRAYQSSDLFIMPSFAEGLPATLLEAMAMELACVSSRVAGVPEAIEDGVNGLLAAPSDERGLAAAIAKLMDDSALRRTLAAAGARKVRESFDRNENSRALARIFERRLGARLL